MKFSKNSLLMSSMLAASVMAFFATTANAQDADNDEIVVTGSRLNVNPNLNSANPVVTVSIEEISARGTVNIEDLTNNLPQVVAAQAGEVSNGASGTAQLDLRGLGAVRTLTMIDGRRLPYASSGSIAPNLDLVPTALIERVEILTGGASAVYGSDAVAGVANFILKDDFDGAEFDLQFGIAQNSNGITRFEEVLADAEQPIPGSVWDGEEYNISGAFGKNFADGRGNITVFGSYQDRGEIIGADRSISACTLGSGDVNGFNCVGSANFRLFGGPGGFAFQQESGTIVNFFDVPGAERTFNFGASNFFQRPAERIQLYGKAKYEVAEGHELFFDASYTDNVSDAQIAPSASFGFGAYSINCDNPFLQGNDGIDLATGIFGCTAEDIAQGNDVSGITASHRNVEGGSRNSRLENSALRFVGGLRGDINESLNYEVFGQYSQTEDTSIATNDFVVSRLQQAFFAVDDGNGNVVCRDTSNGCVPYNIFQRSASGESLVTQEALDFIQDVGVVEGETTQFVLGGNIAANLSDYGISSPYSDDNVGLLVGAEYRVDELESRPDAISQIPGGGFTGVGGATLPVSGEVDVFELFGELEVPIVTGAPLAEELVFKGAYRYSDYGYDGNGTTGGASTSAYGAQLSWAPNDEVSLRGQYQRAVRAPNVIELFTGQDVGLPNLTANAAGLFDPCAGPTPTATAAQCANTGVTAAQFGTILDVISGQTQGITGGNPDLEPEVSDTITLGLVFTPSIAPGFSASFDYFNIKVDEFIAAGIGAQVALDNCLATGDEAFCGLITRDSSGSLNSGTPGVGFLLTNINIASLETQGVDIQLAYDFDLDRFSAGEMTVQYDSTILTDFDDVPFPGSDVTRCAGEFAGACGRPRSSYRHRVFTTWDTPVEGLETTLAWRHFSSVDNDSFSAAEVDSELKAVNYIDISANFEFREGMTLRAGVNNVLLEQPPVTVSAGPPFGNNNTFPTVYDTGRFGFVGLNIKL